MSMLVKPETTIITVDVYGTDVILLKTQEEIDDFIELNELSPDTYPICNGYSAWFNHTGNGKTGFVLMSHDWSVHTLAHECVHVAHFIMKHSGIPISYKNTEVEAYLVGYLFEQAFNDIFEVEET